MLFGFIISDQCANHLRPTPENLTAGLPPFIEEEMHRLVFHLGRLGVIGMEDLAAPGPQDRRDLLAHFVLKAAVTRPFVV